MFFFLYNQPSSSHVNGYFISYASVLEQTFSWSCYIAAVEFVEASTFCRCCRPTFGPRYHRVTQDVSSKSGQYQRAVEFVEASTSCRRCRPTFGPYYHLVMEDIFSKSGQYQRELRHLLQFV